MAGVTYTIIRAKLCGGGSSLDKYASPAHSAVGTATRLFKSPIGQKGVT